MKILIYRNTEKAAPKLGFDCLPIRQLLIWLGPIFILIQAAAPKPKPAAAPKPPAAQPAAKKAAAAKPPAAFTFMYGFQEVGKQ